MPFGKALEAWTFEFLWRISLAQAKVPQPSGARDAFAQPRSQRHPS